MASPYTLNDAPDANLYTSTNAMTNRNFPKNPEYTNFKNASEPDAVMALLCMYQLNTEIRNNTALPKAIIFQSKPQRVSCPCMANTKTETSRNTATRGIRVLNVEGVGIFIQVARKDTEL